MRRQRKGRVEGEREQGRRNGKRKGHIESLDSFSLNLRLDESLIKKWRFY